MNAAVIDDLVPGFDDPVHDAQRVFRRLLAALAHPGRIVRLDDAFTGLHGLSPRTPRSIAAALLALADADTPVWLGPGCARELASLLRFHAGAPIAGAPGRAGFGVSIGAPSADLLMQLERGTPDYPDRSASLFIALDALDGGAAVELLGPGIARGAPITRIAPCGLHADFWRARDACRAEFPLGIDIYLCDATRVIGLPRTTQACWQED